MIHQFVILEQKLFTGVETLKNHSNAREKTKNGINECVFLNAMMKLKMVKK